MQKLLQTSVVASTTNAKGLEPYWSAYTEEINSRLWLPTKTVLHGLEQKCLHTCLSKTVANSWFSTEIHYRPKKKYAPIFCPSSQFFLPESMDFGDTITKSKKIRIYLTATQRAQVKQWFGVSRYVYNKTVEYLKQPDTVASWLSIKGEILGELSDWAKPVPYQIKAVAVRDACKAVQQAKRKYCDGKGVQKVGFRSRKHPKQSCYIPKSAVKPQGIYYTMLGKIHYRESLPEAIKDSRLVCHQGRYYLTVPFQVQRKEGESQARVVALDPGVRCFQTFFSETCCGFLGRDAMGRIQRLCHHLDDLISRSTKVQAKCRYRMRKACNRIRHRIRDLIDELHHKVACFLVKNFDVILLPTFETSQMVKRGRRKLRSKSVRQMLTLGHYRFKRFLKHKAFEFGKVVLDVNESYTSKTVSWTGEIIANLGGRKIIIGNDGQMMDRDLNGARGIFLCALGDTSSLQKACNVHC